MAEIRVLDKHTAELIAAGEVVERPASVAKELLENAIDAGATQITLSIVRGGIQQLQIADNGSGIEAEYIDKAFVRHATSKIASAEDLGHIHTLGFRGEALASIASVARVEVLTRTEADEYACCYRIEGGEPQGMEPGARPRGTTVTVNDLFYNTPARMKFLKKDVSEGTFVADIVLHEALSHPEIAFRFLRDGKQQFMTPGDGQLRSAAYAVLGREFARDLLPLDGDGGVYKVTGLVTPPRACRASRSAQHFYVNGRYVKNRTMMAALENAYKGTLMQGKYPGAILRVDMPADMVDQHLPEAALIIGQTDLPQARLARAANLRAIINVETITGGASNDTVTLTTVASGSVIDLGGDGTGDKLTLGNFVNTLTVLNVETIIGGTTNDLVTLGLLHPWVVGALADQQRFGDLVGVGQRRALGQPLAAFLGARVAHAPGQLGETEIIADAEPHGAEFCFEDRRLIPGSERIGFLEALSALYVDIE